MMAIKGVLFDKDGTLIDVNATWIPFYKTMLEQERGLSPVAVESKMIAAGYDPVTNSFRAGSVLAGGTTRQLVELWWGAETADSHAAITHRLDHEFAPLALKHMKPLMDLQPIFKALKDLGLKLGVATNDSQLSATNHMRALGVAESFEAIIGADSVAIPKPSGQMVDLFAKRTGLKLSEIAMVGDNTHDLEEARNGRAGLAIAVLTGNGKREDLHAHADHVLESVEELPHMLRRLELVSAI
jgi:phosphoglycolate phosphatase